MSVASLASPPRAILLAPAGAELAAAEQAFFASRQPLGFILFARNCQSRAQLAALVRALREAVGRAQAPVLVDMEGGRVARLAPPHWPAFPAAAWFGELYQQDPQAACAAAFASAQRMGGELAALGISWNAAPVLDMPQEDSNPIIGDRAYADQPKPVIALARAACAGLMAAGILPVMKHMPGHGRAKEDSHLTLPRISASAKTLQQHDFIPFKALADLPLAMTAHLVYQAYDALNPATCSPVLIQNLIRGELGFDGLLMSDALEMEALSGSLASRARKALAAGCDIVLHGSGVLAEMKDICQTIPPLTPAALARLARAKAVALPPAGFAA